MPTATRREQDRIRKEKAAKARDRLYRAATQITEQNDIPRVAEILKHVGEEIGPKAIGKLLADNLKNDELPVVQRAFLKEYMATLRTFENTTADVSETQVSKLLDEQIEAILYHDYGMELFDHGTPENPKRRPGRPRRVAPQNGTAGTPNRPEANREAEVEGEEEAAEGEGETGEERRAHGADRPDDLGDAGQQEEAPEASSSGEGIPITSTDSWSLRAATPTTSLPQIEGTGETGAGWQPGDEDDGLCDGSGMGGDGESPVSGVPEGEHPDHLRGEEHHQDRGGAGEEAHGSGGTPDG